MRLLEAAFSIHLALSSGQIESWAEVSSFLRILGLHAHDQRLFQRVTRFKNEYAENVDRENCQTRKLAERRNPQYRPVQGCSNNALLDPTSS